MAYMNVWILRRLKEELAWAIDKLLWVSSNKMLFKTVVSLYHKEAKEKSYIKYKRILYPLLCDPK